MKFMLLIYGNPKNWQHPLFLNPEQPLSPAKQAEMRGDDHAMMNEITATGELVGAHALAEPHQAKLVSARSGSLVTTDGPFIESKEFLAGAFILECDSLERALEIAAKRPDVHFGTIEIREIVEF